MKPNRKKNRVSGIPSDAHGTPETRTRIRVSSRGRVTTSRSNGAKGDHVGYKGRKQNFTRRQAMKLEDAIRDRPNCKHAFLMQYPPAIVRDSLRGNLLTQDQLTAHAGRFWVNVRRFVSSREWSAPLEYVWVREFQGKPWPHIHVLISLELPSDVLRDCWARAIRSTHTNLELTARTPWVGYSRKKYQGVGGATRYLAKWDKGEKDAPLGSDFLASCAWGCSRLSGVVRYEDTAKVLAPVMRDLNRLGRAVERKRGAERGKFQSSDRHGNLLYVSATALEVVLRQHGTLLGWKPASVTAIIRVRASVNADKIV